MTLHESILNFYKSKNAIWIRKNSNFCIIEEHGYKWLCYVNFENFSEHSMRISEELFEELKRETKRNETYYTDSTP